MTGLLLFLGLLLGPARAEEPAPGDSLFVEGGPGRVDAATAARASLPITARGKRLVILLAGSAQTLNEPPGEQQSLIAGLYYDLRDRGEAVVWFRTGDALSRWRDPARAPETLTAHTRRIASELIGALRPSRVSIVGFSWGGSKIIDLAADQGWLRGTPVDRTIAIDPIRIRSLGRPETRRPDFGVNRHVQIYQPARPVRLGEGRLVPGGGRLAAALLDSRLGLHGAPPAGSCPGDACEEVHGLDHEGLNLDREIRRRALYYLDR